jgi:hypothetical protein
VGRQPCTCLAKPDFTSCVYIPPYTLRRDTLPTDAVNDSNCLQVLLSRNGLLPEIPTLLLNPQALTRRYHMRGCLFSAHVKVGHGVIHLRENSSIFFSIQDKHRGIGFRYQHNATPRVATGKTCTSSSLELFLRDAYYQFDFRFISGQYPRLWLDSGLPRLSESTFPRYLSFQFLPPPARDIYRLLWETWALLSMDIKHAVWASLSGPRSSITQVPHRLDAAPSRHNSVMILSPCSCSPSFFSTSVVSMIV